MGTVYGLGEILLSDELLVAVVREPVNGFVQRQPGKLVDLDSWSEPPTPALHDPVARHLAPPAAIHVCGATQGTNDLAAQSRLFFDFAHRTILWRFVWLDLTLRQRPVVVPRTMNNCDLRIAPGADATDNSSRRADHIHFCQLKDSCCHRCSFVECDACSVNLARRNHPHSQAF